MIDDIFKSLGTSGLMPLVIVLGLVVLGFLAVQVQGALRSPRAVKLRALKALREGHTPQGRFTPDRRARGPQEEPEAEEIPLPPLVRMFSEFASRLPLVGQKDRAALRELLLRAGIRRDDALGLFLAIKVTATVLVSGGVFVALNTYGLFSESIILRTGFVLAGMIVGSLLPEFVVKRRVAQRQARILKALPDALDLMVICTEAGLSLDPTVERVSRELKLSAPDLAFELSVLSQEMRFLPTREMALNNFASRNPFRIVRGLATTLIQTLKYGTSLALSLRVLAAETRNARMLAVEEKAARLPAMMSIPLICFMLPAVFMVIGGPAIAQIIKNFF